MEEEKKTFTPVPPMQDAGFERYILRGRGQILQVMKELIDNRCLMSAYIRGGVSYVSAVLKVMPDDEAILIDVSPDAEIHAKALEAEQILCTTQINRIRIQFTATGIRKVVDEGRPALRARLPTEVLRLQRRDFFRLQVPIAHNVTLTIPPAEGSEQAPSETRVVDISGTGIAVQVPADLRELTIGEFLHGCTLRLTDREPLPVDLEVRNINRQLRPNGTEQLRIGLRFESLPRSADTRIQRYIFNVEREINARTRGGF
ncbi:flagellar brake protein [Thauera sp. WH-2]|jgi:c-di-GMP-binding flagellar brake protein YcgR|uniref:flagellar brake protein n=1 Tax=unclassified Thauera TaxID=2609274 RepID=UPI003AAAB8A4